jgi:hypothetical protein
MIWRERITRRRHWRNTDMTSGIEERRIFS